MDSHATKVCKSANYHLRCIRKIRDYLPMEACQILTHATVTSRLDFGNALLCGARDDIIKKLERVQRLAARVVYKKYKNDHTSVTELMWGLHWLPIKARIQYKIIILVFKAFHSGTPAYLAALLKPKIQTRSTRSSVRINLLQIPKLAPYTRSRYSNKAFAIAGPTMWNEILDDELRSCTNIETFKIKLKTLLFQLHY